MLISGRRLVIYGGIINTIKTVDGGEQLAYYFYYHQRNRHYQN
jgi:hypothetical protein